MSVKAFQEPFLNKETQSRILKISLIIDIKVIRFPKNRDVKAKIFVIILSRNVS
jgi:hypothetical protein